MRPVYFILCKGGCPDDHAVRQVMIAATFGHLFCEPQVIGVELPQVRGERNVAGAYFTFLVGDYGIDGNMVVLYQFPADRQHVEFLDAACSLSDTPAHKHVEFQSFPPACPDKAGHVHCLEKSEHRHGCVHPHFKCVGAGGFLGVYFFHMAGEYVESGVWSNKKANKFAPGRRTGICPAKAVHIPNSLPEGPLHERQILLRRIGFISFSPGYKQVCTGRKRNKGLNSRV